MCHAAVWAVINAGLTLVGIDSLNFDSTAGSDRPAHSDLLAAGIAIVTDTTGLLGRSQVPRYPEENVRL